MTLLGRDRWDAAMDALLEAMDRAVEKSVRQSAFIEKKAIRANLEGHVLTGKLRRSVRYMPVTREEFGVYSTNIRASRPYAKKIERRFSYFASGISNAEAQVDANFVRNYLTAMRSG